LVFFLGQLPPFLPLIEENSPSFQHPLPPCFSATIALVFFPFRSDCWSAVFPPLLSPPAFPLLCACVPLLANFLVPGEIEDRSYCSFPLLFYLRHSGPIRFLFWGPIPFLEPHFPQSSRSSLPFQEPPHRFQIMIDHFFSPFFLERPLFPVSFSPYPLCWTFPALFFDGLSTTPLPFMRYHCPWRVPFPLFSFPMILPPLRSPSSLAGKSRNPFSLSFFYLKLRPVLPTEIFFSYGRKGSFFFPFDPPFRMRISVFLCWVELFLTPSSRCGPVCPDPFFRYSLSMFRRTTFFSLSPPFFSRSPCLRDCS